MLGPTTLGKENRRHKRLMSKATKLDLDDLLEIAAAKQWTAPELDAAAEARRAQMPREEAAGSSSIGVAGSKAAGSVEVDLGPDGPREEGEEEQRGN